RGSLHAMRWSDTCSGTRRVLVRRFARASAWTASNPDTNVGSCLAHTPVRAGGGGASLEPGPDGGFLLRTSAGELRAAAVVVCTGAYQRPHRPKVAAGFPNDVLVVDAEEYRNPAALPPGKVLVVGSGQTGCQLSEELHEAGREVFLACGRAPWLPRRVDGRDIVTWLK